MNDPESVGFVLFVNTRACMMQGPSLVTRISPVPDILVLKEHIQTEGVSKQQQ